MSSPVELIHEYEQIERERKRRSGKDNPIEFARSLGLCPRKWQEKVLCSRSRFQLLNCHRQSGKSTVAAILSLHRAYYYPKSTVLLISPSEGQSHEVLRKAILQMSSFPVPPKVLGENHSLVEFENKSRIIALAANEKTVRTYAADLIIEDEAGDVDDDLHAAMLPMLFVTRGRMIVMGTPKGRRGHFFEHWERGGEEWERTEIKASENPDANPEDLLQQKKLLREKYYQEFECQFIQGMGGLVYAGFDEKKNLIDAVPPNSHWIYMLGIDFGYNDATAFTVIAYREKDPICYVIMSFKETGLAPSQTGAKVGEMDALFHFVRIIGDTGGLGKGYAEEIRRRFRIPIEPAQKQNKRGYIDLISGEMATEKIKIVKAHNEELIKELCTLPWNETRTKEHAGFDNHITDSLLYVWRACTTYLQDPEKPKAPIDPTKRIDMDLQEFWEKDARNRGVVASTGKASSFDEGYEFSIPFQEDWL